MDRFHTFGFADIEIENRFSDPTYLDKISELINWKRIDKILKKHYKRNKDAVGNPAYPALRMFKVLLVQKWEKLSDPQMEFALRDKISVIRFVGFPLSSPTPDHSTICRFRNALLKSGAFDELFEEINNQLVKSGFMVKEKSSAVIDATVVEANARPRKTVKVMPEDRKEDEANTTDNVKLEYSVDKDAKWLKKGNKSYYGYKIFMATDESGFILGDLTKPANVSEMKTFEEFVESLSLSSGSAIFADKGYASDSNREILALKGIQDFIMHKKVKNKELTAYQKLSNKMISKVRYVVEQSFGILKKHYDFDRVRYIGLEKVQMEFKLLAMAFNIKKASSMMF